MAIREHSYFQQALSAIELIEASKARRELADIVEFSLSNLGFQTTVATRMPSANSSFQECLYVNTRDEEFASEYFATELEKYDPVVEALQEYQHPFKWNIAHAKSKLASKKRVSSLAEAFGMFDGYTICVHQMGGMGILSASIGKESPPDDAYRALNLVGTYALSKFQAIEREELPSVKLHRREQECLQWVALGKTDQEIAAIINLSPNTVRMYIEQAKEKLGTPNRTAAVVQAIRRSAICI